MGAMKAIHTDVEELIDAIWDSPAPAEVGPVAELLREQGWVSPTEAAIAADLMVQATDRTDTYLPEAHHAVRILRGPGN